jgi:hypothetical protein
MTERTGPDMKPVGWSALYSLVVSVALAVLAYVVRKTDPATFQFIVGALVSLVTGQSIHIGRQTSDVIKSNGNGNGGN